MPHTLVPLEMGISINAAATITNKDSLKSNNKESKPPPKPGHFNRNELQKLRPLKKKDSKISRLPKPRLLKKKDSKKSRLPKLRPLKRKDSKKSRLPRLRPLKRKDAKTLRLPKKKQSANNWLRPRRRAGSTPP